MFDDKVILITGGTGSFGQKFTGYLFEHHKPRKVIIFSRDEFKQHQMAKIFPDSEYAIRFFLGDIRDKERLYRSFEGVDYIIHAAALKQVPAAEYNPFEAVKTNIIGAQNIIDAAIDRGVKKVVALSTDKAVSPINLYGATKLAMEKLFIAANSYVGLKETSFALVRYGNVIGSRGSVIPLFNGMKNNGVKKFPITDERMTRFWITLDQGVSLVAYAVAESVGGEVYVPKIPSMRILDLINAISDDAQYEVVGIRPGEKIHESLVSEDDGRNTVDLKDKYVILPPFANGGNKYHRYTKFPRMTDGFSYRSDNNVKWLTVKEIEQFIEECECE
ncbi:MAG TPA: UDP-N-acetylglucosamine 4,6-dehydratase (inverting) [Syntrophorhabdus sp.]|nr:UDP-N-acetylglucosamine 4,6-dehydratase (inverting) [Syntrophorhabdus sp.]